MASRNALPARLGQYEIKTRLAKGGMGELLLGRQIGSDEPDVVLKCVRARTDAKFREHVRMFLDEARVATLLDHPNIVRVYQVDYQDGYYFMVMEHLEGWDLRTVAGFLHESARLMPIPVVLRCIIDAAQGLHAAHVATTERGEPLHLIHRDVSLANLFLTKTGITKVVDFGVAKSSIQVSKTRVGVLKGKFAYMSPEQCAGETLDARSDIFSLGVVLHELLTGERLFQRDHPLQTVGAITEGFIPPPSRPSTNLPDSLVATVMRALQRDLKMRFDTAAQFVEALQELGNRLTLARHPEVAQFLERLFATQRRETMEIAQAAPLKAWADTMVDRLLPSPRPRPSPLPPPPVASPPPAQLARDTEVTDLPFGDTTQRSSVPDFGALPKKRPPLVGIALITAAVLALALFFWLRAPPLPKMATDPDSIDIELKELLPVPESTPSVGTKPPDPATGLEPPPPLPEVTRPNRDTAGTKGKSVGSTPKTGAKKRSPPARKPGRLTLDSKPWARVYHGNRLLGSTPLVDRELPPGEIHLRLVNPETRREMEVTVIITSGRVTRKSVMLQ